MNTMKTILHFYLNDKAETKITSFYDCKDVSIFKNGYRFWFSVEKLFPKTITEFHKDFNEKFVDSIIEENNNLSDKFGNSEFKIVSTYSSLEYDQNMRGDDNQRLIIEYKCKKLKHFYWGNIPYKFKQFFKLK